MRENSVRHNEDALYRSCRALRRYRARRPDAQHMHFVLDYQARERAEPGIAAARR
jgi:hypothetical protein